MAGPLGVSFGLREVCCVSSTPRANLSAMALPKANGTPQQARRNKAPAEAAKKCRRAFCANFLANFLANFCPLLCSLFVLVFGLRTYPEYDLLIRGREER